MRFWDILMLKRKIYNNWSHYYSYKHTCTFLIEESAGVIFICHFDLCRKFRVIHCVFRFKYDFFPYDLLFMGWQAAPKIIPLTRKVQLLTQKSKQLTRKVGVKFYGFIFLLKQIFLGNFSTKNVLPIRRKHYRLAALLHDVFRKPHRQKVYLKPK